MPKRIEVRDIGVPFDTLSFTRPANTPSGQQIRFVEWLRLSKDSSGKRVTIRPRRGLGAGFGSDLGEDVGQVSSDSLLRDEKLVGNVPVRLADRHQTEHFHFPSTQSARSGFGPLGWRFSRPDSGLGRQIVDVAMQGHRFKERCPERRILDANCGPVQLFGGPGQRFDCFSGAAQINQGTSTSVRHFDIQSPQVDASFAMTGNSRARIVQCLFQVTSVPVNRAPYEERFYTPGNAARKAIGCTFDLPGESKCFGNLFV
jgi:hypothetical protein